MTAIYFKAAWCSACRAMRPVIEQLQKEGYEIQIVDTDTNKDLTKKYEIESLPTTIIIQGGKEIDRIVGKVSADELHKHLTRVDYKIW